jgi:hypothetical protein
MDVTKIKLTKEEKDTLQRNARHLISAYKSNYSLPVLQGQLILLNNMANKYYGKNFNTTCPKCVLNLLKCLYPIAEANKLV